MNAPESSRVGAWLLPAEVAGLALVFAAERVVSSLDGARLALDLVGLGLVIAATGVRVKLAQKASTEQRKVEATLAALSVALLLGVALYFATATERGRELIGVVSRPAATRAKIDSLSTVVWVALTVVALPGLVLGDLALAPMRRAAQIEARRVMTAVMTGLSLGVAAVYCVLFTYAAGTLDQKVDVSYYRTARPGASTRNVVRSLTEPVRAIAFFPRQNEVGIEAQGYLGELSGLSPNLSVETQDRLLSPALAKDAKVTQDGVIVLMRGASRESIAVGTDLKTSASKLKNLDADVQKALLKVMRSERMAYLTTGHGELNTQSDAAADQAGRTAKGLKRILENQNYVLKDLGLAEGLGEQVPSDADLVLVIGPTQALLTEEIASIRRYAARGGKLLLALDPETKADMGSLAAIADLSWERVILASEKVFIRRRHDDSDRRLLVTNRFSSHASVSTLSRNASRAPVVFAGAAPLEKAAGTTSSIDFVVRSLGDTFDDRNENFQLDAPAEKRATSNLAAAVSRPPTEPRPTGAKETSEMRAFVLGDADALSDAALANEPNVLLLLDAVRWLGGEESFAGEIQSTEDVKIEHTKQKDLLWFYGAILGAPALVLGGGLTYTRRARKNAKRRA